MTRLTVFVALNRLVNVLFEGDDLAASVTTVRGDHDAGTAVCDTVLDAFATEAAENHAVDRTDARAREHRDGCLGNVRKVNEHTRPFLAAVALQDVREDADLAMKLLVGEDTPLAWFALPDNGGFIATRTGEMTVEAVFGDVQLAANETTWQRAAANPRTFLHFLRQSRSAA